MNNKINLSLDIADFHQLVKIASCDLPASAKLLNQLLLKSEPTFPYKDHLVAEFPFLTKNEGFDHLSRLLNCQVNFGFFLRDGALQNFLTPTSNSPFVNYSEGTIVVENMESLENATIYLEYFGQVENICILASGVREVVIIAPTCRSVDLRWNQLESAHIFAAGTFKAAFAEFNQDLSLSAVDFFGVNDHFEAVPAAVTPKCYLACPKFVENVDPDPIIESLVGLHPELKNAPILGEIRRACANNENFGFIYSDNKVELVLQEFQSLSTSLRFEREYKEFNLDIHGLKGTLVLIYRNRSRFMQVIETELENAIISGPNCYRTLNMSYNARLRHIELCECGNVREIWLASCSDDCQLLGVEEGISIIK